MSEYIYATDEHKGHWLTGEVIVRCRDCKRYEEDCDWNNPDIEEPDGFCKWGERKVSYGTVDCA